MKKNSNGQEIKNFKETIAKKGKRSEIVKGKIIIWLSTIKQQVNNKNSAFHNVPAADSLA